MLATTALVVLTRPRRSLSRRSSCRSSSSRESSGSPLVVSHTVNRRVGVGISSSSEREGNATRASTRVRDPSCSRRAGSRVGTATGGGAGFGAAGPFGGACYSGTEVLVRLMIGSVGPTVNLSVEGLKDLGT